MAQITDPEMSVLEEHHLPGFVKEKRVQVDNPYSRNYYINNDWRIGKIYFTNRNDLDNVFFKYDLVGHSLEVKSNDDIYLISSKRVDKFHWVDNQNGELIIFEPVDNFISNDEPIVGGFFEVLETYSIGIYEYKLLAYHSIWLYPATASVSLSGSHRANTVHMDESYFLSVNNDLTKFEKRRVKNYNKFGTHSNAIKKFARKNGLYFNNRIEIGQIFARYMELLEN